MKLLAGVVSHLYDAIDKLSVTSLCDITRTEWLKPKKSDKGAIVLHLTGQFNLRLWSKDNLDEWMFLINESVERNKIRRSLLVQNGATKKPPGKQSDPCFLATSAADTSGLYENAGFAQNGLANQSSRTTPPSKQHDNSTTGISTTTSNSGARIESQISTHDTHDSCRRSPTAAKQGANQRSQRTTDSAADSLGGGGGPSEENLSSIRSNAESLKATSLNGSTGQSKLTSSSQSATSTASGRVNLIEREQRRKADNRSSELPSESQSAEANEIDGAQASGRRLPIMINDLGEHRDTSRLQQPDSPASNQLEQADLARGPRGSPRRSAQSSGGVRNKRPSDVSLPVSQLSVQATNGTLESPDRVEDDVRGRKKELKVEDAPGKGSGDRRSEAQGGKLDGLRDNTSAMASDGIVDQTEDCRRSGSSEAHKRGSGKMEMRDTRAPADERATREAAGAQQPGRRPSSNLIRRDDSWQSLVSLTRVGKITPAMQVAQRSLYAQHIMPDASSQAGGQSDRDGQFGNQRHMINIESTVTPLRAPLQRHQSAQAGQQRKLRPLPPIGGQHSASFDVAPTPLTPTAQQQLRMQQQQQQQQPSLSALQSDANQPSVSYRHKLLQLQLLHNSNNVDYIRHNGGHQQTVLNSCSTANDYQIYGPESSIYHYGYSSMRSNLKSAASEFSFIRPTPSAQIGGHHGQSTLPHHQAGSNSLVFAASALADSHQAFTPQHQQHSTRNSVGPPANGKFSAFIQRSDSNNNDVGPPAEAPVQAQQFHLINPNTGERLTNQDLHMETTPGERRAMAVDLAAPMRELPMKPNKKRTHQALGDLNGTANLPKSSSLTSSIASFFRRAFSKRSKKGTKRRSNLAESSSSLGTFDDRFSMVPVVPSAFSTGSKSVDGHRNHQLTPADVQSAQSSAAAQPRMVDMIEAFNNQTLAAEAEEARRRVMPDGQANQPGAGVDFATPVKLSQAPPTGCQMPRAAFNQFGSPLHKSNSISATMGLSLADASCRRSLLHDRELFRSRAAEGGAGSPMMSRSSKVRSANLTPLLAQRDPLTGECPQIGAQFFMSPRLSRADHLPRPSSIYGQPSMISSPVITRDERANNFGVHRNSLHGHHFRDATGRAQLTKASYLDPTKEVAEEIPSPTRESQSLDYDINRSSYHHYQQQPTQLPTRHDRFVDSSPMMAAGRVYSSQDHRDNFDMIPASPSGGNLQQHHRKAVVNPILQSPTMNTIYDNHPMLNEGSGAGMTNAYSHYDNHSHMPMGRNHNPPHFRQLSPSMSRSRAINSMIQFPSADVQSSPVALEQAHYARNIHLASRLNTPSHQRVNGSDRSTVMDMMLENKKPSAVVAPSTPKQSHSNNYFRQSDLNQMSSPLQSPIMAQSRSPMLSRRNHYQQSPLVSQQTRVLSKAAGVQATIIGGDRDSSGCYGTRQSVVNIAGAPGINLDPALAASLLRGTNIDAYERSTFDQSDDRPAKSDSKAFLVSTRLSKSMARSRSSSNDNGTNLTAYRDESGAVGSSNKTHLRSSKDELTSSHSSSSGSRSMNSSIGHGSLRLARVSSSRAETVSSHDDQLAECSGNDNRASRNEPSQGSRGPNLGRPERTSPDQSSRRPSRESSSEPSEGISSNSDSLDKLERNWITSKLIE